MPNIICFPLAMLLGFGIRSIWRPENKGKNKTPFNPIPNQLPKIDIDEERIIKLYLQEWQTIIETQMHFNELIIRFRSITLAGIGTLLGAMLTVNKISSLDKDDLRIAGYTILGLWITAFMIDFFYYHRLLLGSVHQANKYDSNPMLKAYGMFGMTASISNSVHPPTSKILVSSFYLVPTLILFYVMNQLGVY